MLSLRQVREGKGVTQSHVAKIMKITQHHYSEIEAGKKRPNIDSLHRLAVFYGTSMDYLYHAYYRQTVTIYFPDKSLEYGMRLAEKADIQHIIES
jgi:transcriptional regulator with XRE-family HTH domain